MKITLENLDRIHAWAIENQEAMPDLCIQLSFAIGLAKSVLLQETAPDPQRIIETGYEISDLMWRIRWREAGSPLPTPADKTRKLAAGTRVILHAFRRGQTETSQVVSYIESRAGRTVAASEIVEYDERVQLPVYGFRDIAVDRDGDAWAFRDLGEDPCRPSKVKDLPRAVAAARRRA